MDIDMTTLRLLERERDLSLDVLVSAIEQALLSAYHRTPGARQRARVEVDRKTGHVTVWATDPPAVDSDGVASDGAALGRAGGVNRVERPRLRLHRHLLRADERVEEVVDVAGLADVAAATLGTVHPVVERDVARVHAVVGHERGGSACEQRAQLHERR